MRCTSSIVRGSRARRRPTTPRRNLGSAGHPSAENDGRDLRQPPKGPAPSGPSDAWPRRISWANDGSRLSVSTGLRTRQSRTDSVCGSRHRGQSVSVFGSVARGEERPESDIDFLVEFGPSSSLFDLLHIKDDLEALLGSPVDVVSLAALKDRDTEILSEAIPL